jgi:hypothetical protein
VNVDREFLFNQIFSVGVIRLKRNEIIFLVLVFLLILLYTGSSGCLLQNRLGQSPTNIPITSTVNNSPIPTLIVPTPIPTTPIPSIQSGVRIFKDAESICIGQALTYGLINEGNSTILFAMGDPYRIQINNNGTWGSIFGGGGTQGSWELHPGSEIKRGWGFSNDNENGLNEWYNQSDPTREFTVRPGLYRIEFGGRNEETNEPFNVATEFTIRECRSGIPI